MKFFVSCCLALSLIGLSTAGSLEPQLVYTTDNMNLESIHLTNSLRTTNPFRKDTVNSNTFTYDASQNQLYWASGQEIYRTLPIGPGSENILSVPGPAATTVTSIAFDWIANNIYYIANTLTVGVCSLRTRACATLASSSSSNNVGIILHPETGTMYRAINGTDSTGVRVTSMDGSTNDYIPRTFTVEYLTLDHESSDLYFTRRYENSTYTYSYSIQKYNIIDGSTKTFLSLPNSFQPFGLAQHGDFIYLMNRTTILQVAKSSSDFNDTKVVLNGPARVSQLGVLSLDEQPQNRENHCKGDPCSHICVLANANSFTCLCPAGFHLMLDKHTCKYNETRLVYWAESETGAEIRTLSLNTSIQTRSSVHGGLTKGGFAYHIQSDKIYWSFNYNNAIYRANTNGTDQELVLKTNGISVRSLAVDWIAGNIFYTDNALGQVGVCNIDTKKCSIVIEGALEPVGVALYPPNGYLYWTECGGPQSKIMRSYMNGSYSDVYFKVGLGYPAALAVDQATNTVYWADAVNLVIRSATTSSNKTLVTFTPGAIPLSLDVRGDMLFWTEYNNAGNSYAKQALKTNGSSEQVLVVGEKSEYFGHVAVVDELGQPKKRANHCAGSGCVHVCVLYGGYNYACLCPHRLELGSDGKSCVQPESSTTTNTLAL